MNRHVYRTDFHELLPMIMDNNIELIVIDPPYEINYQNLSWDGVNLDWAYLLNEFHRILKDTGNLIIFQGWSEIDRLINLINTQATSKRFMLQNWIIWDRQKTRFGGKKNFTSAREDILWLTKTKDYTFNKEDSLIKKKTTGGYGSKNGSTCRRLSNVWTDVSPIHYKSKEYTGYPTQKPLALMRRLIRIFSNPQDTVLDCFCGSGSTFEAAELEDRQYLGCDSNEEAIKITKNRLKLVY